MTSCNPSSLAVDKRPELYLEESQKLDSNANRECRGAIIVNADDWGIDEKTTWHIYECVKRGTVSSASGMVFMKDSSPAADLAREHAVDVGLHLNLTAPFSQPGCKAQLIYHQERVNRFLLRNRYAQTIYNPVLSNSFHYLVSAQLEEFERLYNSPAQRVDGHHHMHLCANVLLDRLLPAGTIARRSFSFNASEKSWLNRLYRRTIDYLLTRRHRVADFFYSLAPVEPVERLRQIGWISRNSVVELETHPVNPEEFQLLTSEERVRKLLGSDPVRGFQRSLLSPAVASRNA